ncbi:hypothetical protein HDU97_006515 [Phlyctochytrium planicorne]|nr:hypothetical protein HDU97_006515 [Phlyctochytrium planicorne]
MLKECKLSVEHPEDGSKAGTVLVGVLTLDDGVASEKEEVTGMETGAAAEDVDRSKKTDLEVMDAIPPGNGRRIAILCHGLLAHKNALFFPMISRSLLPMASFRFDFAGVGESSGGPFTQSNYWSDLEDLTVVISAFVAAGWRIHVLMGHSRGSAVTMMYAIRHPRAIRYLVNISGRKEIVKGFKERFGGALERVIQEGKYEFEVRRRGVVEKVDVAVDTTEWQKLDEELKLAQCLPKSLPVLSLHGLEDNIVPPTAAAGFSSLIRNHTLYLIPSGDHNFSSPNSRTELCDGIKEWLVKEETGMDRYWRTWGGIGSRVVRVKGVKNFRDAGGYPRYCEERKKPVWIKRGLLFRSASFAKCDNDGLATLHSLSVRTMFDLRSDVEVSSEDVTRYTSFKRIHCPVFPATDFSPPAIAVRWKNYTQGSKGFSQAYASILAAGKEAFTAVLKGIAEGNGASVVHCTAGKDRTGVLVAVLLMWLGVEEDIVVRDYALTEVLMSYSDEEIARFADYSSNTLSHESIRTMLGSRKENMEKTLEVLAEVYGSAKDYLEKYVGVEMDVLDRVRTVLTEELDGEKREDYFDDEDRANAIIGHLLTKPPPRGIIASAFKLSAILDEADKGSYIFLARPQQLRLSVRQALLMHQAGGSHAFEFLRRLPIEEIQKELNAAGLKPGPNRLAAAQGGILPYRDEGIEIMTKYTLFGSTTSPYVRKVLIVARELNVLDSITFKETAVLPTKGETEVSANGNPLGKIPTLVVTSGSTSVPLFGSQTISQYLIDTHPASHLSLPAPPSFSRYEILTLESLADGILDAALLSRYESVLRPAEKRWDDWTQGQMGKIERALDELDKRAAGFGKGPQVNLGEIAASCAVGYLNFRFSDLKWRVGREKLAEWFDDFSCRESFKATSPPS